MRRDFAGGADVAAAGELGLEISLEFRDSLSQILPGHEAPSQTNAITDWQRRDAF